MADDETLLSPTDNSKKPINPFLYCTSPRLMFTGNYFSSNGFSEIDQAIIMSPTSILDSKPSSGFVNPFSSETNTPKTPLPEASRRPWDSKLGLAIVDALNEEKSHPELSKPDKTRMVLFGSQLKIQIPPQESGIGYPGSLSVSEMERSEDYTCVISHGPNPRTTHIFDDCIVERCCGVFSCNSSSKERGFLHGDHDQSSFVQSENFLSSCYSCRKKLGQGNDIYIYRGEKAFCSSECRYQEMILDEDVDKMEPDDVW